MSASSSGPVSGVDGVQISYQVDGPAVAPWLILSNIEQPAAFLAAIRAFLGLPG